MQMLYSKSFVAYWPHITCTNKQCATIFAFRSEDLDRSLICETKYSIYYRSIALFSILHTQTGDYSMINHQQWQRY